MTMNIFKSVICHDYSVVRAQRKAIQFKTNGVHMIGLAWIANILSVAGIYIIYFLVNNRRIDIYDLLYELHYWELAGRVGIIILLAMVYLVAFAAYGGRQTFLSIIHQFMDQDENHQRVASFKGGLYFYCSMVLVISVVSALFYLIKVAGY
jgi:hypothetical protein